jgi:hypothetical protein
VKSDSGKRTVRKPNLFPRLEMSSSAFLKLTGIAHVMLTSLHVLPLDLMYFAAPPAIADKITSLIAIRGEFIGEMGE